MGYVAVKGGENAINNAKKLIEKFRRENRLAVDHVMGEGSLYAPELAELAVKQAEGDLIEASFLIRAYRSTLPRIGYTEPIDTHDMFVIQANLINIQGYTRRSDIRGYERLYAKIAGV